MSVAVMGAERVGTLEQEGSVIFTFAHLSLCHCQYEASFKVPNSANQVNTKETL